MKNCFPFLTFLLVCGCHQTPQEKTVVDASGIIKVKTELVKSTLGEQVLHYSGSIEPSQTIPLNFQSSGMVDAVYVQEGDVVHKGQLLASVDKSDNENIASAAVAKYQQAKDAYDRLKSVHEKGSLSDIKWVEMETNLKQAESQMLISKSNLEKCQLRAPTDGFIGKRNVEPGQTAFSTAAPIELVKIESVLVKIAVPENEISLFKKGFKAKFSVGALQGKSFEGTVTHVGIVADNISRTYEVKIQLSNKGNELKPGMVCDVEYSANHQGELLVVPNIAVNRTSTGETFVFVVSDDKKTVKKQDIVVGNYDEQGIIVLNGLQKGATIVVEGKEKLTDNSSISL